MGVGNAIQARKLSMLSFVISVASDIEVVAV
jgi:hypothetical protein